ncbi:MAG: hypothetical protein DCC55_23770 [Chloroflexi bacterium]|nr:MAG: hypothetical protein DCC55_23770 [Chloroflexota bacterium]
MFINTVKWMSIALMSTMLWWMSTAVAQAQSCDAALAAYDDAIQPGVCQTIGVGKACYGSSQITALPESLAFNALGKTANIASLSSINTRLPNGAALLYAQTDEGRVKLIVFGNSNALPSQGSAGSVFTLRPSSGGGYVCNNTPSGMMIQTNQGQQGTLTINGVKVRLGSTAFIWIEGGVLFDQDPRIGRRLGQRNPDAPLCSGFDSDCHFGDDRCAAGSRLVWGPYCQRGSYPYIENGLYRVTLYGSGRVIAGATEYGSNNRDHFAFARHEFTLPSSYTFCWRGQQPGGQGFETIVHSTGSPARIDHITLEYLGSDCARSYTAASGRNGVMAVANIEGHITVSALGETRSLDVGEAVHILLRDDQPQTLSPVLPAGEVMASPVIRWLALDPAGLPEVNRGVQLRAPVAQLVETSDRDPSSLSIRVVAYAPDVGTRDGAGIDHVDFRVTDPTGRIVLQRAERTAAYCGFGGDDPCTVWDFGENDNTWPDGQPLQAGVHQLWAEATDVNGQTSAPVTARIYLEPAITDNRGPAIEYLGTRPQVRASGGYCVGSDITVYARITDPAGVANAQLWYRLTTEESIGSSDEPVVLLRSPSSLLSQPAQPLDQWTALEMDNADDFYFATMDGLPRGRLEYYVVASDEFGNQSEAAVNTHEIFFCVD